jgi:hypothetical protein
MQSLVVLAFDALSDKTPVDPDKFLFRYAMWES